MDVGFIVSLATISTTKIRKSFNSTWKKGKIIKHDLQWQKKEMPEKKSNIRKYEIYGFSTFRGRA